MQRSLEQHSRLALSSLHLSLENDNGRAVLTANSRNSSSIQAFTAFSSGGFPMALLDYTGYAAAVCTTGAYVPQVLRVWRTRSTQDISLKMFLVLVAGLVLWLVYGFWKGEIPLIAANGVTLMLASIILYFKIKHG
jgi:MtN3 and saliva related transmembrane protein